MAKGKEARDGEYRIMATIHSTFEVTDTISAPSESEAEEKFNAKYQNSVLDQHLPGEWIHQANEIEDHEIEVLTEEEEEEEEEEEL